MGCPYRSIVIALDPPTYDFSPCPEVGLSRDGGSANPQEVDPRMHTRSQSSVTEPISRPAATFSAATFATSWGNGCSADRLPSMDRSSAGLALAAVSPQAMSVVAVTRRCAGPEVDGS